MIIVKNDKIIKLDFFYYFRFNLTNKTSVTNIKTCTILHAYCTYNNIVRLNFKATEKSLFL